MEPLKNIVSKNLIFLRKANNLTQMDLAQKINYSDNAISRWERGEVVPDIEILESLAHFYHISVNELMDENLPDFYEQKEDDSQKISRFLTVLFSISIVWFVTFVAYIYLKMFASMNFWLIFVIGVPISCVIALYFNKKWGNKVISVIFSSVMLWSIIACVYLYYLDYNMWMLFLLGIPGQSAIISGFYLKPGKKRKID